MKTILITIIGVLVAFLLVLRIRLLNKSGAATPPKTLAAFANHFNSLVLEIGRSPWTGNDDHRYTEIAGFDLATAPRDENGLSLVHISDGLKTSDGAWFIEPGELVLIRDNKTGQYV